MKQVNLFLKLMLMKEAAPDKTGNPMGWVGYMENLKARVEEIVMRELIFALNLPAECRYTGSSKSNAPIKSFRTARISQNEMSLAYSYSRR